MSPEQPSPSLDVKPTPLFHAVLVGDGDWPLVKTFPTRAELITYLKALKAHGPTRAFLFCGRRLFISKGPYRYLLDGQEAPIPLFEVPVCGEADPEHYLWDDPAEGPDPDYAAATESLREPRPAQQQSSGRGSGEADRGLAE